LSLRAFRAAAVILDGRRLLEVDDFDRERKQSAELHLASLPVGKHELVVAVVNHSAHPALLAFCDPLGLHTGANWESSLDNRAWNRAVTVDAPRGPPAYVEPDTVGAAVRRTWPLLLIAAAFGAVLVLVRRIANERDVRVMKYALMTAWALVAVNNLFALPLSLGMDVAAHVDYVRDMLRDWRPPLPNEGWQRHQPPLYYFASALVWLPLHALGVESLERAMRVIPLVCGLVQIEIAWRFARLVLPGRFGAQIIALVCAACLPMNVYIAQFPGNEPLAGVLMAAVLYLILAEIAHAGEARGLKPLVVLGLVLGLACLTKLTALLLVPVACLAVARSRRRSPTGPRAIGAAVLVASLSFLVCGWYFVRNWIAVGNPVVGAWNGRETNVDWWQDPSYRIPAHFLRFGEAFVRPVYSATRGVWDALYSSTWLDGTLSGGTHSPWNGSLALTLAWIGAPLTLAAFAGTLVRADESTRSLRRILLLAIACVVGSLLCVYARLPVYTTAKATYALGLLPAIATLMALGLSPLLARRAGAAAVGALLACLAAFSLGAFFVVS
jgi:hypothetical protein